MSLVLATNFEHGSLIDSVSNTLFDQSSTPVFKNSSKGLGLYTKNGYLTRSNFTYNPTNKISFEIATNISFINTTSQNFIETVTGSSFTTPHLLIARNGAVGSQYKIYVSYSTGAAQAFLQPIIFDCGDIHIMISLDFNLTTGMSNFYKNGILSSTVNATTPSFPNSSYTLRLLGGTQGGSNSYTNYGIKYFDHIVTQDEVNHYYQHFLRRKSLNKKTKDFYIISNPELKEEGIIAHYDFSSYKNGKVLLNSISPNYANNYNPSQYNSSTTKPYVNKVKDSLYFNGMNSLRDGNYSGFLIPNLYSKLSTENSFSICFFVKYEKIEYTAEKFIFASNVTSQTNQILLEYSSSGNDLYLNIYKSGILYIKSFIDYDSFYDNFISIIVTWDTTLLDANLYVNTIKATGISGGASYSMSASLSSIGCTTSNTRSFSGKMYDCKIYDKVLSEQEIKDYHNSWVSKPVITEDFSNYGSGEIPRNWIKTKTTQYTTNVPNFIVTEYKPNETLNTTTNLLTNTFDWVDTNDDGIGDGWVKFYTTEDVSIVTGNGFSGRAQKMTATTGGTAQAIKYNTPVFSVYNTRYKLSLKYRSSAAWSVYHSSASNLSAFVANSGDAIYAETYLELRAFPTSPGDLAFYMPTINDWFEISEVVLTPVPVPVTKYLRANSYAGFYTTGGIKSNIAYGTWEFDYNSYGGSLSFIKFISTNISGDVAGTGYSIRIGGNVYGCQLVLTENAVTNHWTTTALYIKIHTWYSYRITRDLTGKFSVYIKGDTFGSEYVLISTTGGTGTNPVTDNTITTCKYFILAVTGGDSFANLKIYPGIVV
jgi:hypothetical protein